MADPVTPPDDEPDAPRSQHDEAQDSVARSRLYRLGQGASYGKPERKRNSQAQADAAERDAEEYEAEAAAFSALIRDLVSELEEEKKQMPRKYSDQGLDKLIQRIGGIVDDLINQLEVDTADHYAFVYRTIEGPGRLERVIELGIGYGKLLEGYDVAGYSRFEARARLQRFIAALSALDPYGTDPYTPPANG